MIPVLFALCVSFTTDAAAVPQTSPWAYAYVPHPDALASRVRGSSLSGFAPWFGTKAAQHPWVLSWSQSLGDAPQFSTDPSIPRWVTSPGDYDLISSSDLQHVLGMVAKGPLGAAASQVIRRVGLDNLQRATKRAKVGTDHVLRTEVELTLAPPKHGLADAFGPAAPCLHPGSVPDKAAEWVAIQMVPGKVWQVVETVVGGMWPLQWGLARTQMDVLEDSIGQRWMEDILGFSPQTWVMYEVPAGARDADTVGVLGLKQGNAAAAYVREFLAVVHDLAPELSIQAQTRDGVPVWLLRQGARETYLAVSGNHLVVATSSAALAGQLAQAGADATWPGSCTTAVAWGTHDDAGMMRRVTERVGTAKLTANLKSMAAAVGGKALTPKEAFRGLGRSTWWMDATPDGWLVQMTSRAKE